MEILQIVWFFLVLFLFMGYSILDGFDLGVGVLFKYLGRTENEKEVLFSAIGPFWDGNEVWIITGGGALFAAFPFVYATVFSGFYLAFMFLLFALIFRAVSLEFWHQSEKNKGAWGWAFVVGSFIPSLLYGVAIGNIILGIPLSDNYDFTGSFFTLLRPFPLIVGLLGLTMICIHGASYTMLKTEGEVYNRAAKSLSLLWIVFIVVFALALGSTFIWKPEALSNVLAWVFCALTLSSWLLQRIFLKKSKDAGIFATSVVMFISLWGIAAAVNYPYLVVASEGPSMPLTLSSSQYSLTAMLIIAGIGMPIVIAYQIYVYRVFKGKVKTEELGGY